MTLLDAAVDEQSARTAVRGLMDPKPDLLLCIALRGMSARALEAAGEALRVPCLLWPVQGRFALPSSALAAGALRASGLPVELIYAPPDNETALRRAHVVLRAATAWTRLRHGRIGVLGELFSNLVSCRYDAGAMARRLGVTLVPMSFPEVQGEMERVGAAEVSRFRAGISDMKAGGALETLPLEQGIRLHLALKKIATEKGIDGIAAECWSGMRKELGLNPCLGFVEDSYALACEGDVQLCAAFLALRGLTGAYGYVGDLYDVDMDGVLTLVHCGAPASLSARRCDVQLCASGVAAERGFQTVVCRPNIAPGPATVLRLFGAGCDSLHVAAADILGAESGKDMRLTAKLKGDRWEFLRWCLGNHYIVAAGDIREELQLLAEWLGITVHET